MLVHLSNTSPYVCDLNRGPIEQANRMASAPTKKATALLEHKESFPKQTRTPLKLLAPGEVPRDSTIPTTDINASLQPVWYTEQTIVDDHHGQQEDIASIIQEQQQQQGKSLLPRTTLSPIASESPIISEEIEQLPNQPLLMHKSSTFTIEPSMNVDSPLNDSEKENVINEDPIVQPSDDSFRALEQLLGLGSNTTVRDSPKTNHDTLSLTVVTPTDIINSTRRSSRRSYAQKIDAGSLPSSQEISTMPTIESINSIDPPSFLVDNTTMEEEQPSTTTNQQTSFDITDNDTIKDDSINDDEGNFSFELTDFSNNSKQESMVAIAEPTPLPATTTAIRAPTCADVAYRALIKPRAGGRVSQPVKADSPLAKPLKLRSSAPTSRMLRSSCRRMSSDSPAQDTMNEEQSAPANSECFVNNTNTELVEIVTLPEEDENEQEKTTSMSLNTEETNQNTSVQSERTTTPPKPIMPILSREYTYNTPRRRSSQRRRTMLSSSYATPMQSEQTTMNMEQLNSPSIASNSMLGILLTKPGESQWSNSSVRTSTPTTINDEEIPNSPAIASKSMLNILLTQPTDVEPKGARKTSSARASRRTVVNEEAPNSPSIASKSMLDILLTKPTIAANTPPTRGSRRTAVNEETTNSPSIASKSMLDILLTKPTVVANTPPARASRRTAVNEETPNSPSIASKSMLNILLTKPTEIQPNILQEPSPARPSRRTAINEEVTKSPLIPSTSMLGILLTNPTEAEPSVIPKSSPVRNSTRQTARLSTNPTPRASINPLHSSTPSSTRHKSLQMVSIGEQEQVTTTVRQQINIEIQEEQQQEIEMVVPLNDTEESITLPSTIETSVQTTPTLDVSLRRHLNAIQQQTTPDVHVDKLSSIVMVEEEKETTPLQTKVVVNLHRNVRFQLTPATDARLVAKEIFEENFRGLKPDVVINQIPIVTEVKHDVVKLIPIKKATKPKKKASAPKRKRLQSKAKPVEKKVPKTQKKKKVTKPPKPTPAVEDTKKKIVVAPPAKQASSKQTTPKAKATPIAKRAPPKRATSKTKTTPIAKRAASKRATSKAKTTPIAKRAAPKRATSKTKTTPVAKRAASKPAVPEAKTKPITKRAAPKPAAPVIASEPVVKRTTRKRTIPEATTKPTGKRVPSKRTASQPTTEPVAKRAKTAKSVEVKKEAIKTPLPPVNLPKTRGRSANNKEIVIQPAETKIAPSARKTSKRRMESVTKPVESKKKENIQSIPAIQTPELKQKFEAMTVVTLKSRLNTHKANIPKGAKKADLIALLIKIESNLLKDRKETAPITVHPTTMTTRRRRKN